MQAESSIVRVRSHLLCLGVISLFEEVSVNIEKSIKKPTIHLVSVTNDNYAVPLAVMLNSLLKNKVSENPIKIYVIASQLYPKNRSLLAKTVGKFNLKIEFSPIDPAIYKNFKTVYYLTKETYYRISIPDLLNEKTDKVIYLDCDIIVKADITELWNIDIDKYLLGAVEDFWVRRNSPLSMSSGSAYFNAGVLLINLKKWREEHIKDKVIEFIKTNSAKVKFCSQDPLNAILRDKWLQLDPKWNYMPHYLNYPGLRNIKPAIIHYAGLKKPWKDNCRLKEEYFKYRKSVVI